MGSVMDFGAGDWTPKLSSLSYDWNCVPGMFSKLSTWHSQTMRKNLHVTYCLTTNFTCKKTPQCFCKSCFGSLDHYLRLRMQHNAQP